MRINEPPSVKNSLVKTKRKELKVDYNIRSRPSSVTLNKSPYLSHTMEEVAHRQTTGTRLGINPISI
jgi:hypothetical protein